MGDAAELPLGLVPGHHIHAGRGEAMLLQADLDRLDLRRVSLVVRIEKDLVVEFDAVDPGPSHPPHLGFDRGVEAGAAVAGRAEAVEELARAPMPGREADSEVGEEPVDPFAFEEAGILGIEGCEKLGSEVHARRFTSIPTVAGRPAPVPFHPPYRPIGPTCPNCPISPIRPKGPTEVHNHRQLSTIIEACATFTTKRSNWR